MTLHKVKIVEVVQDTDFRKSEWTNFDSWKSRSKRDLTRDEVVVFISKGKNQMVFAQDPTVVDNDVLIKVSQTIIATRRVRLLLGSNLDLALLPNYAEVAGYQLIWFKRINRSMSEKQMVATAAHNVQKVISIQEGKKKKKKAA